MLADVPPSDRTRSAPRQLRAHRGFTLVELVVVIGIVVFLVGLTMSLGTAVVDQASRRATETTLRLLDQAVNEWELAADRKLTWWDTHDQQKDRDRADIHGDTAEILIITELMAAITRAPEVRRIVEQIDPDDVMRYERGSYPSWINAPVEREQMDGLDGELVVLDAWGWPIYATHPGRPWRPSDDHQRDDDGTIRTYNEMGYGVARQRQVCFVSAGPDRQFGRFAAEPGTDAHEQALDNIFSYPVR
jgi:prepilin-type N-terminal cleavage/methylation domain-containing protein